MMKALRSAASSKLFPQFALRFYRSMRSAVSRQIAPNTVLNARLQARLRSLYDAGQIKVIFDIGAHKGNWATAMQTLMPDARMILFEANPLHAKDLESTGFEHHLGALSKPGVEECDFYSPDDFSGSTGGSYYREVTPGFDEMSGVKLKASTLAEVVTSKGLPQPDLIKIDTQGSELDIIAGGSSTFENAKWILMELPALEYNVGSPDAGAYFARLDELGFLPVDLCEIHMFGSVVVQFDFLFANKRLIDSNVLGSLRK